MMFDSATENADSKFMNACDLVYERAAQNPAGIAFWSPRRSVSFGDFVGSAQQVRRSLVKKGLRPGDAVLLIADLGPELYAAVLGILSHGCQVLFIEPWLSVERIEHILNICQPKAFISNWFGRLWGLRCRAVRNIPLQLRLAACFEGDRQLFPAERVPSTQTAIVSFTSGTSSQPKGVVRSHGYLIEQHRTLSRALGHHHVTGSDLCIFANFALSNLAAGRTTVLVNRRWSVTYLRDLRFLSKDLQIGSLTCGPGFLHHSWDQLELPNLQSLHVGGALTDCKQMEAVIARWPEAHILHVYGSSEAEPVAVCEAQDALKHSMQAGYFQTLFLGQPIAEIKANIEVDDLWVSGDHVCPAYIGADEANARDKRRDELGQLWHRMGDRIISDDQGWWYQGRNFQLQSDFLLEQKIYQSLGHSKAFLHRYRDELILSGEISSGIGKKLLNEFPDISRVERHKIKRDVRHRARIDRKKSTKVR